MSFPKLGEYRGRKDFLNNFYLDHRFLLNGENKDVWILGLDKTKCEIEKPVYDYIEEGKIEIVTEIISSPAFYCEIVKNFTQLKTSKENFSGSIEMQSYVKNAILHRPKYHVYKARSQGHLHPRSAASLVWVW